ncbi:hypothetical protein GDO78_018803 [Eleutherodactylus coqui]|uniref:Secreted protein n=1 Tax=Eleutherodactylus coqui TaxID=57060 RepID=A0A8J6EIW7_ELECQ|nr:hypothetical protein GDO78_018803 [Eleutherodactylus coqui]
MHSTILSFISLLSLLSSPSPLVLRNCLYCLPCCFLYLRAGLHRKGPRRASLQHGLGPPQPAIPTTLTHSSFTLLYFSHTLTTRSSSHFNIFQRD